MVKRIYEVDVLVNGKPLKEYLHKTRTYVEGRKGTTFSLRLRNHSSERAVFVPTIDGLSVIDGKVASFDSRGYIVNAYDSVTVEGWRTSDHDIAKFFFSSPKDAYAHSKGGDMNIGVIGCAVFKERPSDKKTTITYGTMDTPLFFDGRTYETSYVAYSKSLDNAVVSCLSTSSIPSEVEQRLGTGWGETKTSEVITLSFDRERDPCELFEIYYNTREELEKLGITFKEPLYVTPNAFPGETYCEPPLKISKEKRT